MEKAVFSFGETLWDLLPSGPALGGAPFNFAFRVNSLGDTGIIVTRLGRDDYGREARERITALGMETSCLQKDDHHATGTVQVTLDEKRNPNFFIVPDVAYDFIEVTYELLELAAAADCFYFGTVAQRAPTARQTLHRLLDASAESVKFLDINLRRDCFFKETITESLKRANILKMNLQEAHYLAELFEVSISSLPDFCAEMMEEWSLSCCLVTLGEHGAFAASVDGKKVYVPGYQVNVLDTCGSGDAFAAGFIHERLRGKSLAECCQLGNALGTMVAMQSGATAPVSMEEVRHFMNAEHLRFYEPTLKPHEVS
jgi:fructokinase